MNIVMCNRLIPSVNNAPCRPVNLLDSLSAPESDEKSFASNAFVAVTHSLSLSLSLSFLFAVIVCYGVFHAACRLNFDAAVMFILQESES